MMPEREFDLIVYGAYGYTGLLISRLCKNEGLKVLLSGRTEEKLEAVKRETGFEGMATDINDQVGLKEMVARAKAVIHCAGPFSHTANQMAEACLRTGTHYLDITGEHEVFTHLHSLDERAKERGIMIMPGTGFDVVPTDCLALYLKNRLPQASHLRLAFAMIPTGVSRGTARTAAQSFGKQSLIRVGGQLKSVGKKPMVMEIDFGFRRLTAVCISWGDIVTAWYTTGIPNIEVYMSASKGLIRSIRIALRWSWFFRIGFVQKMILRQIDKRPPGPSEEILSGGKSIIYGKAWEEGGQSVESRLETINGYRLTAEMAVIIAKKVICGNFTVGFQTPAGCYGPELVMEIPDSRRTDF